MKTTIRLVLALSLLSLGCATHGHTNEEKKQSFYEQAIGNVFQIQQHVSVCTPGREWADEKNQLLGTGFLVQRFEGKKSEIFLVTARHVIEGKYDLFIQREFKAKSGKNGAYLVLPHSDWAFHPMECSPRFFPIDVAVMGIPEPPIGSITFAYCVDKCISKDDKELQNHLGDAPFPTERAIFFGFPGDDVVHKLPEPFVRAGVVAYERKVKGLRLGGKPSFDEQLFLIDAPSFGGNSGGPVMAEPLPLSGGIRLFGLITGGSYVQSNKDYAIATSVTRIKETIEHAHPISSKTSSKWSLEPPQLSIQCISDK
jgi:hypothetical protein